MRRARCASCPVTGGRRRDGAASIAIREAPEYGVNFLVFSHALFQSVDGFLSSPERREAIATLGRLADERKIPWYLWIDELDDIPQRFRTDGKLPDAVYARQVTLQLGKHTGIESLKPPDRVNMDDPALAEYLTARYNIDLFALEMRWRMANRERALEEDARILEDVRQMMSVDQD